MAKQQPFRFDQDDPHAPELQLLADETATEAVLAQCPRLLELLPEALCARTEPTAQKTRMMRGVLRALLDAAFEALMTDPEDAETTYRDAVTALSAHNKDARAGDTLAAGAMLGLVTESPRGTTRPPSEMFKKPSMGSKAVRQQLAGEWLGSARASSARRFRDHEEKCLDTLRHYLLDFLGDERVLDRLAQSLRSAASISSAAPGITIADSSGVVSSKPLNNTRRSGEDLSTPSPEPPPVAPRDPTFPYLDSSNWVGAPAPPVQTRDRSKRNRTWRNAAALVVATLAATGVVLWRTVGHSDGRVVTVYNQVTNGATGMRPDRPAYLSTTTTNYCKDVGCALPGTDFNTGAKLKAICQTQGDRVTNGQDADPIDDHNPGLAESTLWYGIRWPDGRFGYVSELWVQKSDRGGLGLRNC